MLDKSVKIDRIKYLTTTFAVLLISFCITVNEILTVRRLHGTLTVEFRSVFKFLRFAYRFETLTVSVTVSHFSIPASCERNPY